MIAIYFYISIKNTFHFANILQAFVGSIVFPDELFPVHFLYFPSPTQISVMFLSIQFSFGLTDNAFINLLQKLLWKSKVLLLWKSKVLYLVTENQM